MSQIDEKITAIRRSHLAVMMHKDNDSWACKFSTRCSPRSKLLSVYLAGTGEWVNGSWSWPLKKKKNKKKKQPGRNQQNWETDTLMDFFNIFFVNCDSKFNFVHYPVARSNTIRDIRLRLLEWYWSRVIKKNQAEVLCKRSSIRTYCCSAASQ